MITLFNKICSVVPETKWQSCYVGGFGLLGHLKYIYSTEKNVFKHKMPSLGRLLQVWSQQGISKEMFSFFNSTVFVFFPWISGWLNSAVIFLQYVPIEKHLWHEEGSPVKIYQKFDAAETGFVGWTGPNIFLIFVQSKQLLGAM